MTEESAAEEFAAKRPEAADLMAQYANANAGIEGADTDRLMDIGHAQRTVRGIELTNDGHRVLRQYADMYPEIYKKIRPAESIERSHDGQ